MLRYQDPGEVSWFWGPHALGRSDNIMCSLATPAGLKVLVHGNPGIKGLSPQSQGPCGQNVLSVLLCSFMGAVRKGSQAAGLWGAVQLPATQHQNLPCSSGPAGAVGQVKCHVWLWGALRLPLAQHPDSADELPLS